MRVVVLFVGVLGVASVGACGSKTSEMLGPSIAGSAGSSAGAECTAGDTRNCVGPGACDGGQACGRDGRWSQCDCGVSGGSDGSAGGPSIGMGGAGQNSGGASGVAGEFGVAGATSEAGAAGEAGTGAIMSDQPCPMVSIPLDCSGQCRPTPNGCHSCGAILDLGAVTPSDGMVLMRTPSHPGAHCFLCNTPTQTSVAFQIQVGWSNPPGGSWHVTASPPWYPALDQSSCAPQQPESCIELADSVVLWTADPNAPSVNVILHSGPCP